MSVDGPLYLRMYKLYCTRCRQRWAGNDKGKMEGLPREGRREEFGWFSLQKGRPHRLKKIIKAKEVQHKWPWVWLRQKLWCSPLRKSDFRADRQTKKRCTEVWGVYIRCVRWLHCNVVSWCGPEDVCDLSSRVTCGSKMIRSFLLLGIPFSYWAVQHPADSRALLSLQHYCWPVWTKGVGKKRAFLQVVL